MEADLRLETAIRTHVLHVLKLVGGNQTRAAKKLAISRETVRRIQAKPLTEKSSRQYRLLRYSCPFCLAATGERCYNADGQFVSAHAERIERLRAVQARNRAAAERLNTRQALRAEQRMAAFWRKQNLHE